MFNIDVIDAGTVRRISYRTGDSLLETLHSAGINIRTGCQKTGACTLCRIFVREGNAGPITTAEKSELGHWLSQGMRLACQVVPNGDLVVELISQGNATTLATDFVQSGYQTEGLIRTDVPSTGCGVAVDIGTTNVTISIFQWKNGERLAGQTFSNPQREYGSDVITRVLKAAEDLSFAKELHNRLFNKIKEALQELTRVANVGLEEITGIGIVGNTAMLALFHSSSYQQLLDPQYWEKTLILPDTDEKGIIDFFQISRQASVKVIDPLAGFVGSDLLAGITAIRLTDKEPGTLFLDFGTNTEIALWDGERVWVTAAAGGPAFEGCGMSFGSPAVPGAIFKVSRPEKPENSFRTLTIDGKDAIGICGSGYVDIISKLLDMNVLDAIGRLAGAPEKEIVVMETPLIKVTKWDIDMFQRAKAAVAAGIEVLLHRAGMLSADIKHIYVAGNFGRFLDVANAQRIGLLPSINADYVYLCGNTALRGCEDIMLNGTARDMLSTIRKKASYINLAYDSEFESIFIDRLYLRPF